MPKMETIRNNGREFEFEYTGEGAEEAARAKAQAVGFMACPSVWQQSPDAWRVKYFTVD